MKKTSTKNSWHKIGWWWIIIALLAIVTLIVLGVGVYFIYSAGHSLPANELRFSAAQGQSSSRFENKGSYYAIMPNSTTRAGLIIYPGAFGDPRAYVGRYAELAEKGIAVFVIRSPFNFALLDVNRGSKILRDNPNITNWYVAGHSLGGVAACEFARSHESELHGLILLGSYCNGNASNLSIPVLSVSGSRDGLSTTAKINASRSNLPTSTYFVVIDGANHSQFGSFSQLQGSDNQAEISDESAQDQILAAISNFIR